MGSELSKACHTLVTPEMPGTAFPGCLDFPHLQEKEAEHTYEQGCAAGQRMQWHGDMRKISWGYG